MPISWLGSKEDPLLLRTVPLMFRLNLKLLWSVRGSTPGAQSRRSPPWGLASLTSSLTTCSPGHKVCTDVACHHEVTLETVQTEANELPDPSPLMLQERVGQVPFFLPQMQKQTISCSLTCCASSLNGLWTEWGWG